jgi:DNA-binding MarR family transcriptional regulator
VLSTLVEAGPQTQVELANATGTDRTAMVYLLDELEQAMLVERSPNPDDRRSYLVRLTPAGARLQRRAATELVGQREKLLAPLSGKERGELVDLLTRIADHWEELNPVRSRTQKSRSARALEALGHLADSDE